MVQRVIVVGDRTTHDGTVITGADDNTVHGKPIARLGDLVDCPVHGRNEIVEGDAGYGIGTRPAALEGHRTACGSVLIGSVDKTVG